MQRGALAERPRCKPRSSLLYLALSADRTDPVQVFMFDALYCSDSVLRDVRNIVRLQTERLSHVGARTREFLLRSWGTATVARERLRLPPLQQRQVSPKQSRHCQEAVPLWRYFVSQANV